MGKSFFEETEEQQGNIPALTGALLEIASIERSKTGENSQTPGCRMYVVDFKVVEPKEFKGMFVRDWITVGTAEDPTAKEKSTWKAGREKGPGRLTRLLTRSGTPLLEDDEEWMEQAVGNQVVAPISVRQDGGGNRVGKLFFRPSDDDAPEIGEAEGKRGAAKPKAVAKAAKPVKEAPAKVAATDDDDED